MKLKAPALLMTAAVGLVLAVSSAHADGKPSRGHKYFNTICSACHSVAPGANGAAPTLYGVVGRKAGSVPGFSYSSALESAGFVWTSDKLDQFLENPGGLVPGTMMVIRISNANERADIIAYLAQESAAANNN